MARYGNTTMVMLHLKPGASQPADCAAGAAIWLGSKLIEPMGLQSMVPQPIASTPVANSMTVHYRLYPAGCRAADVRLFLKPSATGLVPLRLRLDDDAVLDWRMFVVP